MNAFSRFSPLFSSPPLFLFLFLLFLASHPYPPPLSLPAHSPAPNEKYYNIPNDVDGAKKLDITLSLTQDRFPPTASQQLN